MESLEYDCSWTTPGLVPVQDMVLCRLENAQVSFHLGRAHFHNVHPWCWSQAVIRPPTAVNTITTICEG
jgi:hypothetical protein